MTNSALRDRLLDLEEQAAKLGFLTPEDEAALARVRVLAGKMARHERLYAEWSERGLGET